ncbi:MAG: C45 family peptidase [Anaerolineaceae bacterium]
MIRVLNLTGNAYQIGRQHGEQVADLRPQIENSMKIRLAELCKNDPDLSPYIDEINGIWEQYAPDTLDMLKGISDSLHLDWEEYFTYTIASYLDSCLKNITPNRGCSSWAANGGITSDDAPILVKNRDYHPDHRSLQCLARIEPSSGNSFLCLTSAGSPAVFSSGINSQGLAVVDTFVPSTDVGPGIARYSLEMDILQNMATVQEAIDYLPTRPHFGDGTLTLIDSQGNMATFEIAHSVQAVRQSDEGFIVSTNHFSTPQTCSVWVDREPEHLKGNTLGRRKQLEESLRAAKGQVNAQWAQIRMGDHSDPLTAVCRHIELDPLCETISCVIYLPWQKAMFVANGQPCRTPFEYVRL